MKTKIAQCKFIFCSLLLLFYAQGTKSQDTLFYTQNQPVIDIGQFARFHIDKKESLTLTKVQELPEASFQKSKRDVMNFGNTTASIYFKLYIKNKTAEPLFISFENNELQHIELISIDEFGQKTMQKGGSFEPDSNRYLKRGNTILKIGTKPTVVFIKANTHSGFYFPVKLATMRSLMNQSYILDVFKGFVVGIMLALFLYNLFIFFTVRDPLYILYCLYVLAGLWTFTHLNGLWYFVWSDFEFFNRFLGIQVTALFAALFSFRFLNSRELTPRLYKLMLGFFVVILLLIPIEYLDIQPATNIFLEIVTLAGASVLFVSGVFAYLNGNKSALYYSLAWVFFLSGTVITLLCMLDVIPFNFLTFNAAVIGACIENILLSFALANRINIYRAESAQAQALAFQRLEENERLVREQNKVLEDKVHERTLELEHSLNNLKSAQTQLIQSEKLASLGELTAGIAHEIQNPLNFVNNFSDLSVELVDDIQMEMEKPDTDQEYLGELFSDLRQNQEKINHHGKRASSIVRGMLEHSRTSAGDREYIDINQLADEYLRLSYHGLRAKDKTFVADFKTELEEPLAKISVIRQDIGRVLLNLINNAFYAVKEKAKKTKPESGYQPCVTVATQLKEKMILVKIKDNGTGMPDHVKAKVFQPFFTTKPTGEGTGLGLSLSYDIITKGHGGTLEVESSEGHGTEFLIGLPII